MTAPLVRPRFLKWSVVVFVLLLPFVIHAVWDYMETRRLAVSIAKMRERHEPVITLDIHPFKTPLGEGADAARYYRAAATLVGMEWDEEQRTRLRARVTDATWSDTWPDDLMTDLRARVRREEEALGLMDRAAPLPFEGFGSGYYARFALGDVMTLMRVSSRAVCIAGITTSPDKVWMEQMARNISFAEVGFLNGCRYLLHDRDAKFCAAFTEILEAVGIKGVKLPPRSPNLNANLERWHRSVKDECLSKMIFFGEASLRQALSNYVLHFHGERNHQGKGNVILFPRPEDRIGESTGEIQTRERLGGMLKFYYREAA